MDKLAIFVDGANMFYAQRKLKWHIDWEKILGYFSKGHELYNAFYYSGFRGPKEISMDKFLKKLSFLGYTVRRKPLKRIIDEESGKSIEKSNLDIEIAIDMLNTAERYDKAILLSGDGDFERVIELLRTKGKEIVVVSTKGIIARELINAADRYIDLKNIKNEIEKKN